LPAPLRKLSIASITAVDNYWQIAGIGDFNGDGKDDILWRGQNGEVGNWLASQTGTFAYNDAAGITSASTSWHVQPEHPWI
jgi:hypothetical protein